MSVTCCSSPRPPTSSWSVSDAIQKESSSQSSLIHYTHTHWHLPLCTDSPAVSGRMMMISAPLMSGPTNFCYIVQHPKEHHQPSILYTLETGIHAIIIITTFTIRVSSS